MRYNLVTHAYGSAVRQSLDWYTPDAVKATVVFYYSGSWRTGRKQDFRFVADTLCSMGCEVVIPDYRLFPEHQFSDIIKDARDAMNYVIEQQPPDRPLVVMGHSAGAQLAALVTLNKQLVSAPQRIDAFIGLSGPYDFYPFTEDDHWELFGPPERYPESQPVNYVRADAPPLYLLHGEDDKRVRRGHSKSLMEKQIAVGGDARREVYPGMGHADAVVSFSRLHRRKSRLIHDIQLYIDQVAEQYKVIH